MSEKIATDSPILTEKDLETLEAVEEEEVHHGLDPVNEIFRKFGAALAIVSMLALWVLLVVSVVLRYTTGSSLAFATELPSYIFPWVITGGVIVAMSVGGHIAIDLFISRLGKRNLVRMYVTIWTFSGLLFLLLTILCIRLVGPISAQLSPILGWPMIGSFAAFIVMSVSLCIQSFALAVHVARSRDVEHEEVLGV